ncbi:MAG: hypothetical protein AAB577_01805 [Patescibacteria group bacterium]
MILTPHILVGVAIATKVQNPILGLVFVLLSHYFLDLFPHNEYSIKNIRGGRWSVSLPDFLKAFLDIALALVIISFTAGFSPMIITAVAVSILPDGLTLLQCIFPENKLLIKHLKIHWAINDVSENKKIPDVMGIISQVLVAAIAIYLLLQPRTLL